MEVFLVKKIVKCIGLQGFFLPLSQVINDEFKKLAESVLTI